MSADGQAPALLAAVATILLANGQTTEATQVAAERLAKALGSDARLSVRWGEITLYQGGAIAATGQDAQPTGVDVGRVTATEDVVERVCDGSLSVPAALAELDAIRHRSPVSLARFAPMAAAGAAALAVIFGAPDVLTVALIAASAGAGACLRRAVSHLSGNPFLQPLAAALLAGLAGGLVERLGLPVAQRLVIVCPCMVLVPGPHFLNGVMDLVRARIPLGAARLAQAFLMVVAICVGLLAGLALTGAAFPPGGDTVSVPLALDVAAAGVAVAAYGSFFNMPWRLLSMPVGIGMAAHALRWALLEQGVSLPLAAFGATLLVGAVVTPLSHYFRLPFGASAFAAVVSLIPGVFMFEAASAIVAASHLDPAASTGPLLDAMRNGATAGLILLAMGAGLIGPKMAIDHALDHWMVRRG